MHTLFSHFYFVHSNHITKHSLLLLLLLLHSLLNYDDNDKATDAYSAVYILATA